MTSTAITAINKFFNMFSNCMMPKTAGVTKIYGCGELTDTLNTWRKRFIMIIIIMLCYFEIFTSCYQLSSCKPFQNIILNAKRFQRSSEKHCKRGDCQNKQFLNFLTSKKIFITLQYSEDILGIFWNRHSWNVRRISWKNYFVITRISQKISICYYQIIHF